MFRLLDLFGSSTSRNPKNFLLRRRELRIIQNIQTLFQGIDVKILSTKRESVSNLRVFTSLKKCERQWIFELWLVFSGKGFVPDISVCTAAGQPPLACCNWTLPPANWQSPPNQSHGFSFFDGMWGAAIHLDFHMFSQLALISRRPGHLLRQQLDDTAWKAWTCRPLSVE